MFNYIIVTGDWHLKNLYWQGCEKHNLHLTNDLCRCLPQYRPSSIHFYQRSVKFHSIRRFRWLQVDVMREDNNTEPVLSGPPCPPCSPPARSPTGEASSCTATTGARPRPGQAVSSFSVMASVNTSGCTTKLRRY